MARPLSLNVSTTLELHYSQSRSKSIKFEQQIRNKLLLHLRRSTIDQSYKGLNQMALVSVNRDITATLTN
jgi:hypothetical protein